MSQTPIPWGIDGSTEVFQPNELISAEHLSAVINSAAKRVNSGLTDANVRTPEVGYDGIPEAKVTFVDPDGAGHNHDGVNSAPIRRGVVTHPILGSGGKFLGAPWAANVSTKIATVAGKFIVRWEADRQTDRIPSVIRVATSAPINHSYFLSIANVRVIATNWMVSTDAGVKAHQLRGNPIPESVSVTSNAVVIVLRQHISHRWGDVKAEFGLLGIQWVASFDCEFSTI